MKNCIIKIDEKGYYEFRTSWGRVPKEEASKMTRNEAEMIKRGLRKVGCVNATIEEIKRVNHEN